MFQLLKEFKGQENPKYLIKTMSKKKGDPFLTCQQYASNLLSMIK